MVNNVPYVKFSPAAGNLTMISTGGVFQDYFYASPAAGGPQIVGKLAVTPTNPTITLSDVKQTSKTLMFSERRNDPANLNGPSTRRWDYAAPDSTFSGSSAPSLPPGMRVENEWAFSWPDTITPPANGNPNPSFDSSITTPGVSVKVPLFPFRTDQGGNSTTPLNPNSMHAGIVIMTFCDGSVSSVSDSVSDSPGWCKTYFAVPDVSNTN
jgi:hypothetical protein